MEAEFVEIESYFTLHAEFYSSFFDRSTVAKIQKNDECLRGVMHQSGTSDLTSIIIVGKSITILKYHDCLLLLKLVLVEVKVVIR